MTGADEVDAVVAALREHAGGPVDVFVQVAGHVS